MPEKKDKKRVGFKEFDPSKYVDVEPVLDEAIEGKTIVISWGRMNPPTIGHEKLVNTLLKYKARLKSDAAVYLSHSEDKDKNPLSYRDKIKYAKKAFGSIVKTSKARTIMEVMKELEGKYGTVYIVVGSDRLAEFDSLLNRYNKKEYTFKHIQAVTAGDRDPDSEGVSGMSASKMRAAVKAGDEKAFSSGLPKKLQRDAKKIYKDVQKGMKLTEEARVEETEKQEIVEALNRAQRRKRALAMRRARHKIKRGREKAMKRKASQEQLKKRARRGAIKMLQKKFAKHKRYADMEPNEKERIEKKIKKIPKSRIERIAKKMMIQVKQKERERFAAKATDNPTTQKKEDVNEVAGAVVKGVVKGIPKVAKAAIKNKKVRKAIIGAMGAKAVAGAAAALGGAALGTAQAANLAGKGVGYAAGKARNAMSKRESFREFVEQLESNHIKEAKDERKKEVAQDPDIKDMPGTQPKPYYKGVAKDKKDDRQRHFNRQAKKDDDDPSAYKPAPGDKEAKTKPSSHTKDFKKMYGEELQEMWGTYVRKKPHMLLDKNNKVKFDKRFKMYRNKMDESLEPNDVKDLMESTEDFMQEGKAETALKNKAEKSGMPYSILKQVYDRGVAAWKGGHRPGTNPHQWGLARVNSFATKSSGTWGKADKDLAAKVRKEEVELIESSGQDYANKLTQYAMKNGGIDKKDLIKVADKIAKAKNNREMKKIGDAIDDMDTEPRDLIKGSVALLMGPDAFRKMFGEKLSNRDIAQYKLMTPKSMREEVELDEGKKEKMYVRMMQNKVQDTQKALDPKSALVKKVISDTGKGKEFKKINGMLIDVNDILGDIEMNVKEEVEMPSKVDGRRVSFKEKIRALGYVKAEKNDDSEDDYQKARNKAIKKAVNTAPEVKETLNSKVEDLIAEKLKASDDMGDWIKDFQDSDAPQFKGKSKEERRKMAIAAKLDAEREAGMRKESLEERFKVGTMSSDNEIKNSEAEVKKLAKFSFKYKLPPKYQDILDTKEITLYWDGKIAAVDMSSADGMWALDPQDYRGVRVRRQADLKKLADAYFEGVLKEL